MADSSVLPNFWRNLVLQLGHHTASIKHALIALGAAHRSFLTKGSAGFLSLENDKCEAFAIQQYNLAIQHVTAVVADQSVINIQITLVCCLLFVCLENLKGRYNESLRHLRAGARLLTSSYLPPEESARLSGEGFDSTWDIAIMFSWFGADASIFVQEEVVPHLGFYSSFAADEGDVSEPYPNLATARKVLQSINIDFGALVACCYWGCKHSSCNAQQRKMQEHPALRAVWKEDAPWAALYSRFKHWTRRLSHNIENIMRKPSTQHELQEAMALSLNQLVWAAQFECGPYFEESKVTRNHELFEDILNQSERLIQSLASINHPVFTLDADIVPTLHFVASFTTDSALQWRAIRLLRSMHRREGMWDSLEVAEYLEATLLAKALEL